MVKRKYGQYKNRLEKFLASQNGKRAFNFAYSWGASIVVAGALFKLLHLPGANTMLCVGMGIEVIMFFISAFDYPSKEYNWEEVFPALKSQDEADRPSVVAGEGTAVTGINVDLIRPNSSITPQAFSSTPSISASEAKNAVGLPPQIDLEEGDARSLSESIKRLSLVTEQLGRMAELGNSTQLYLEQLEQLAESMKSFSESTVALTQVSNNLLSSYQSVSGEQGGVIDHSRGYVNQMESLNKNLSGLNTIYEIQLKSISSQIHTIDQINAGLNHIKEMYDNTTTDYCVESEKMTQLMAALNAVYYRMLDAMNMNMGAQPTGGGRQQTP